jgi:hypothetical protein
VIEAEPDVVPVESELFAALTVFVVAIPTEETFAARVNSAPTAPALTKRPTARSAACSFISASMRLWSERFLCGDREPAESYCSLAVEFCDVRAAKFSEFSVRYISIFDRYVFREMLGKLKENF